MREPALDPFGAMADRLNSTDVHALFLNSAAQAANDVAEELHTTTPEQFAENIVLDLHEDEAVIGVSWQGADAAFEWEYGTSTAPGHGSMAMAERELSALASGYAAVEVSRVATGS